MALTASSDDLASVSYCLAWPVAAAATSCADVSSSRQHLHLIRQDNLSLAMRADQPNAMRPDQAILLHQLPCGLIEQSSAGAAMRPDQARKAMRCQVS